MLALHCTVLAPLLPFLLPVVKALQLNCAAFLQCQSSSLNWCCTRASSPHPNHASTPSPPSLCPVPTVKLFRIYRPSTFSKRARFAKVKQWLNPSLFRLLFASQRNGCNPKHWQDESQHRSLAKINDGVATANKCSKNLHQNAKEGKRKRLAKQKNAMQ